MSHVCQICPVSRSSNVNVFMSYSSVRQMCPMSCSFWPLMSKLLRRSFDEQQICVSDISCHGRSGEGLQHMLGATQRAFSASWSRSFRLGIFHFSKIFWTYRTYLKHAKEDQCDALWCKLQIPRDFGALFPLFWNTHTKRGNLTIFVFFRSNILRSFFLVVELEVVVCIFKIKKESFWWQTTGEFDYQRE